MAEEFALKNGRKINREEFKRTIKEGASNFNEKSKKILSAFDVDKNSKLDDKELDNIFNEITEYSANNGNSVFEVKGAEEFINKAKTTDGKTLKELGIKAGDVFDFLGRFVNSDEENVKRKKDNNFTYTMTLKDGYGDDSEGVLEWGADSLAKIRTVYPNAETAYLKNGKVTVLDKSGEPVLDKNGNALEVAFKETPKTFSEELAEMSVLGHKASPLEKIMHQAEIQKELDRLNSLETPSESYLELSRSIEFQKMNKKEQTEAMLKWTGEKFYQAKEQGDYAAMKEYLAEGFGLAFQKMDMASIGNTKISVEGFKDFLKTWSGFDAIVGQLDKVIDDNNSENITTAEKIWAFTKGVGDAIDGFIGTQGVAFMGTLSLAGEAAAAGGIGEAWALATQAYFGYEGVSSVAEGAEILNDAKTEEEFRLSGEMVGNGAIMMHGAYKSFKGGLTGKLQSGMEAKKAVKEIQKCKSAEEITELRENLKDLSYAKEEVAFLDKECLKRLSELSKDMTAKLTKTPKSEISSKLDTVKDKESFWASRQKINEMTKIKLAAKPEFEAFVKKPIETDTIKIEEKVSEFLEKLSDNAKAKFEYIINNSSEYKNYTNEQKAQLINGLETTAKIFGLYKSSYVPELSVIKQKTELIKDTNIKSYIETELEYAEKLPKDKQPEKLSELETLADAINNFDEKYSMIQIPDYDSYSPAAQSRKVRSIDHKNNGNLEYNPELIEKIQEHIKYDAMKNFIAKYDKINPDKSNYLYTLYLEKLSPELKAKCNEILKDTGVKVFIDNTISDQVANLDTIKKELTLWKNAGLKTPSMIDEFDVSAPYIMQKIQGNLAGAFTDKDRLTITASLRNTRLIGENIGSILRHELFHLNDSNFDIVIWDSENPVHNKILTNKEKFSEYLKNAGINEFMIDYAFSIPREFAAVALQGDVSKYPTEFKLILKQMGVPEKVLNFKTPESYIHTDKLNETISDIKPEGVKKNQQSEHQHNSNIDLNTLQTEYKFNEKQMEAISPMAESYPQEVAQAIKLNEGKTNPDKIIETAGKIISDKINDTLPEVEISIYSPKAEITMPISGERFRADNKTLDVNLPEGVTDAVPMPEKIKAELGTTSIHLAKEYANTLDGCKEQISDIFGKDIKGEGHTKLSSVKTVSMRPKGAASIEPKLEKGLRKNGHLDYESARNWIGDAVGARIITHNLQKLTDANIDKMINEMEVEGKPLNQRQKVLLKKYIYEGNFNTESEKLEGFYLFERFTRPLVEARTQEAVDELVLSAAKYRMQKDNLSISDLRDRGILTNERLLSRLETDESINPLEILGINNYTGLYGIPEFTVNQIDLLSHVLGDKITISTRSDIGDKVYENTKYTSPEEILKNENNNEMPKSIKNAGYRTAQMNVKYKDRTLGEIQFRGEETNKIGEYEHIAYDLRQGKNTLGPMFDEFKKAIDKLTDDEYKIYNKYLEACYNYYNRIELGLPAKRPMLPKNLDPILSEENMKYLHDKNEARLKELKKNFKEGIINN